MLHLDSRCFEVIERRHQNVYSSKKNIGKFPRCFVGGRDFHIEEDIAPTLIFCISPYTVVFSCVKKENKWGKYLPSQCHADSSSVSCLSSPSSARMSAKSMQNLQSFLWHRSQQNMGNFISGIFETIMVQWQYVTQFWVKKRQTLLGSQNVQF